MVMAPLAADNSIAFCVWSFHVTVRRWWESTWDIFRQLIPSHCRTLFIQDSVRRHHVLLQILITLEVLIKFVCKLIYFHQCIERNKLIKQANSFSDGFRRYLVILQVVIILKVFFRSPCNLISLPNSSNRTILYTI